ncbi:hypothetical protein PMAYCL1PPCAC_04824, partial [Pristionchus mayeri]
MDVNLLIVPEAIGCLLFALLISRFQLNANSNTPLTPFFVLFHATGVAGIVSIIGGWFIRLAVTLPVTPDTAYIAYIGHWWKRQNLRRLIVLQFGIPALIHIYYIRADIDWEWRDGVQAYDGLAESVGLWTRLVFGGIYVIYIAVSIPLNVLTMLRMRALINQKMISQQRLLHQNRTLVLYGACSTVAHFLCAIHQIYWAWAYFTRNEYHQDMARDLAAPVNDVTTFCNPLLLLIVSPQARESINCRSKKTRVKSTSQSE